MALTKITSSVIGSNVIGSSQIANAAIESRHLSPTISFSNLTLSSANIGSFYSWSDSNANAYGYSANSKFSITNYFVDDNQLFRQGVYPLTVLTRSENVFVIESSTGGPGLLFSSNGISLGRTSQTIFPTSNGYILTVRGNFITVGDAYVTANLDVLGLSTSPNAVANVSTANNWYLANDYNTYSTLAANDGTTLATAFGNDHSTLFSAYSNDGSTLATARGNDHSTLFSAYQNDHVTFNSITNDPAIKFTSNKTFFRDVIIEGNLFILGDSVTANVSNISTEDKTLVVNWNSTDALAEGAGIQIAGTSSALLANIIYASASASKFRLGAGTLTSADDIARTRDYQSNDYNTYSTLAANDGTTLATAFGNDHATLFSAYSNDGATLATARGNDHSTLATARGNDHATLYLAYANDFNTYTSLNANLNSVQNNVNAKVSKAGDIMTGELTLSGPPTSASNAATKAYVDSAIGLTLQPRYNTNVSSGTSNCFFVRVSASSPASINYVYSSLNGIDQVNGVDFIYNSGNDTIQYTDSSVPAGLRVLIRAFTN